MIRPAATRRRDSARCLPGPARQALCAAASWPAPRAAAREAAADADGAPSTPALAAVGLPPCSSESLQVVAGSWDGLTGNSVATLRAINIGAAPCALRGTPHLSLHQGGEEIGLRPRPLTRLAPVDPAGDGVGLMPGDTACSRLFCPGYRTAADQRTPQRLTVQIAGAGAPIRVSFRTEPGRHDPGPAPFDLKAGVEGGAVIEVGPWERDLSSAG